MQSDVTTSSNTIGKPGIGLECRLCGIFLKRLHMHIRNVHDLEKDEYLKQFPNEDPTLTCPTLRKSYSKAGIVGGNNCKPKMVAEGRWDAIQVSRSIAMKKCIAEDPRQQELRRQNMIRLNKTDEQRKRSSETAIKTSARPEILEKRTKNLKNWRDNNYDDFYNNCCHKMLSSWHSKPELALFKAISEKYIDFQHNKIITSHLFKSKSGRRQIDILCENKKIAVLYDGPAHFISIHGSKTLQNVKISDEDVNTALPILGYTLIRISDSEYTNRKFEIFTQKCLDKLFLLIDENKPGLYRLGDEYGENNIL
jgi:hypothetical protein